MTRRPTVLAIVQAGGKGSRMDVLTRERAKPALPFGGRYQLIDFAISSLANSGISDVWVSVQYQAGSLDRHLAGGRPWDLDRTRGGLQRLVPEQGGGAATQTGFSAGDADDLYRSRDQIDRFGADAVVVTSADHVFALDLRDVVDEHLSTGASCTIVTTEVSRKQAAAKAVVTVVDDGRVTGVAYKPEKPSGTILASEIFVYDPAALLPALDAIRADQVGSADEGDTGIGDFGEHLLPRLVAGGAVRAHAMTGYWRDLGTPSEYLAAHRDMLAGKVDAIGRPGWPIHTRWPELPAAVVRPGAEIDDSVISAGCDIGGHERHSVVGPGVVVEAGARVEDCVLAANLRVCRGASVGTAVLDSGVEVGRDASVGEVAGGRRLADEQVTLVGKDSVEGRRVVIDAGGRLEPGTRA
ncbi:MAG TPA: sugar phosphate nucleotidyltransferase [Dermatophilaceae bacterium]|nr:sugar phosphate nucleotidyltransferase [Dermatophilaceae bacterium]